MDEMGRGTSTFDGLALAEAAVRHLVTVNRSWTLFSTHYFELTLLADQLSSIINVCVEAKEHQEKIIFLHTLKEGIARKSYGIAVARLAGMPEAVLQEARRILNRLECQHTVQPDMLKLD